MQVGWPGLSRAITLSVILTSAFWIALGAWLFQAHIRAEHQGGQHVSLQQSQDVARASRASFLGGLTGGTQRVAGPAVLANARPGKLVIPVAGAAPTSLSDTFTQARAAGERRHDAIDIMAGEGTPVLAASSGQVEKLFASDEGGNTIYVRSPDRRLITYYAHLSAYEPGLREGARVRQGQRLGFVGHTGNAHAEAPHLHFAMWAADPAQGWSQQGAPINPYPLLVSQGE